MTLRAGIDLGGTKIEAIVLDDDGRELLRRRLSTPQGNYVETLACIVDLIEGAERDLGERVSVGVGTPGALSRVTGRLKNSNSVCLNDQPLLHDLQRMLGRPVRIANDANCFALSETTDGTAAGAEVVFGVILGTGCGGGIVYRGEVLGGLQ